MMDTGLVGIPGIEGRISGDMGWEEAKDCDRRSREGEIGGDIVRVEGLGILSEHHITVVGSNGRDDARAIAPEVLFADLDGAIRLLLVGALLHSHLAIRIAFWLTVLAEAIEQGLSRVVFFDPGIEVLDINSDDVA